MSRQTDRSAGHASGTTRRDFLKLGALATAALGSGAIAKPMARPADVPPYGDGNQWPGRICIYRDEGMWSGDVFDAERIKQVVSYGVRILTGVPDVGEAFETLFPGVATDSTIAIKVNCIGPTNSHWEVAAGVVEGLSQMLGGTYDVSNVIIFDRHNLGSYGYTAERFTFGGNTAQIYHNANCYSGYYPTAGHQLSNYLIDCDYIINLPALKSHSIASNAITLALKNHYGSCCPASLCGNISGLLELNSDQYVKTKTNLVLMDGIRGTFNGGPGEHPQYWETFPDGTPNTLFFSTDPVTNEYWGRDAINAERAHRGWSLKDADWIEDASNPDFGYLIGVSDPELMTLLYPTDVEEDHGEIQTGTFLAPNVPNPFTDATTVRFRMASQGSARLMITDATGRVVRQLAERSFPAGYASVRWDGRDSRGLPLAAGVYFAKLETRDGTRSRQLVLTR
jgi:hypothetical protein